MTLADDDREPRIRRLLELVREGRTDMAAQSVAFGGAEYTDPALAELERERVFGAVPSIVAHCSELPTPKSFVTVRMPRNNIIVMRQSDGSVMSFVNHCRHRGALLEERQSGRCRLFSCGYHRWSYDPDGQLRTVTYDESFGPVDTSKQGLITLPTEERHGFIWVVDRAGAQIDVAEWLGPEMDAAMASYDTQSLMTFRATRARALPPGAQEPRSLA